MSTRHHQSPRSRSVVWLTPPEIIAQLGGWESFDLDPCAAPEPRPWPTARRMNAEADADGLAIRWHGRVWLNPPFSTHEIRRWLARMADHGRGTALMAAGTETEAFRRRVWESASGLLFLYGRLHFHYPDGQRAKINSGAASVLCAYGQDDLDRLAASGLDGQIVPLRFARAFMLGALEPASWSEEMRRWLGSQAGPVSVSDAYRHFARSPKARSPHWRAKVRQQIVRQGRRLGRDRYEARA